MIRSDLGVKFYVYCVIRTEKKTLFETTEIILTSMQKAEKEIEEAKKEKNAADYLFKIEKRCVW